MGLRNTADQWGWATKALHWVMAILIVGLLAVGTYMTSLTPGMDRFDLTQTHKSFGFVVFTLACIRVMWRAVNKTPAPIAEANALEHALASGAHIALYLLMFLLPISGWLMASASPFNDVDAYIYIPNEVFGLFELPDPIVPGDKALTEFLGKVHRFAGYALAALLVLHAAAALQHHFIRRDGVLLRMLPFGRWPR